MRPQSIVLGVSYFLRLLSRKDADGTIEKVFYHTHYFCCKDNINNNNPMKKKQLFRLILLYISSDLTQKNV